MITSVFKQHNQTHCSANQIEVFCLKRLPITSVTEVTSVQQLVISLHFLITVQAPSQLPKPIWLGLGNGWSLEN